MILTLEHISFKSKIPEERFKDCEMQVWGDRL
jgi:hypothetical protein